LLRSGDPHVGTEPGQLRAISSTLWPPIRTTVIGSALDAGVTTVRCRLNIQRNVSRTSESTRAST